MIHLKHQKPKQALFIRICYGGHPDSWARDTNVNVETHCPLIKNFYSESLVIKTEKTQDLPKFNDILTYYSVYEKKHKGDKHSSLSIRTQNRKRRHKLSPSLPTTSTKPIMSGVLSFKDRIQNFLFSLRN